MSPYRKKRNWKLLALSVVILLAFFAASWLFRLRSSDLERLIYANCVANEQQDAIIVAQLEAAKVRAHASLPPNSAELLYQLDVINDGINALEPPEESDCPQPEGTSP